MGVTVDQVMMHCSLTRGAFYAHFESKAELYRASLLWSPSNSHLAREKPEEVDDVEWLVYLFDQYLSLEHVRGQRPCPLAFLATDVASRDTETQKIYAEIYIRVNQKIESLLRKAQLQCSSYGGVASLTSMMIGAVAIARNIQEDFVAEEILSACRERIVEILHSENPASHHFNTLRVSLDPD